MNGKTKKLSSPDKQNVTEFFRRMHYFKRRRKMEKINLFQKKRGRDTSYSYSFNTKAPHTSQNPDHPHQVIDTCAGLLQGDDVSLIPEETLPSPTPPSFFRASRMDTLRRTTKSIKNADNFLGQVNSELDDKLIRVHAGVAKNSSNLDHKKLPALSGHYRIWILWDSYILALFLGYFYFLSYW